MEKHMKNNIEKIIAHREVEWDVIKETASAIATFDQSPWTANLSNQIEAILKKNCRALPDELPSLRWRYPPTIPY